MLRCLTALLFLAAASAFPIASGDFALREFSGGCRVSGHVMAPNNATLRLSVFVPPDYTELHPDAPSGIMSSWNFTIRAENGTALVLENSGPDPVVVLLSVNCTVATDDPEPPAESPEEGKFPIVPVAVAAGVTTVAVVAGVAVVFHLCPPCRRGGKNAGRSFVYTDAELSDMVKEARSSVTASV